MPALKALPLGWNEQHPKHPSAMPSIGELATFLGFVLGLCTIGLVLRMGVRGFEYLTGIDCGLADAVSVHVMRGVRARRKERESEEEES